MSRSWAIGLTALLCAGCTGSFLGDGSGKPVPSLGPRPVGSAANGSDAASGDKANVVMRRLTRFEYDSTIRDLLGVDTAPAASSFPPEETAMHFDNNAEALAFPPTLAEQALASATKLGRLVATEPTRWATCAGSAKDEACARSVLEAFGKRAYRRPLDPAELDTLLGVFRGGAAKSFEHGVELAAATVLISVPFLYRVEHGDGAIVAGKPGWVRPTSWEMATRLSYLFLGSAPDAPLLQAAEADGLKDGPPIEAQARRLFARAKPSLAHFHEQWLRFGGIASAAKDPALFPRFGGGAAEALRQEADLFVESVAFEGGGLRELLTASYGFVNQQTAGLYGVAATGLGSSLGRIGLDPAQRAGFFTLAGPMAMLADFGKTSPIRRAAFVRENLLCEVLPPPPADAAASIPDIQPGLTRRQAVERHSSDPACVGCHRLIDSIGVSFENYDAAGQWRTEEEGMPIDASGSVADSSIPAFGNAVELMARIAASKEGQGCLAKQLFRFALGRSEKGSDADLERLTGVVGETGGSYESLLVALTQTDAFLYMPKPEVLP